MKRRTLVLSLGALGALGTRASAGPTPMFDEWMKDPVFRNLHKHILKQGQKLVGADDLRDRVLYTSTRRNDHLQVYRAGKEHFLCIVEDERTTVVHCFSRTIPEYVGGV